MNPYSCSFVMFGLWETDAQHSHIDLLKLIGLDSQAHIHQSI